MDGRVIILDVCVKELKKFPLELQKDLLTIVEQLSDGVIFSSSIKTDALYWQGCT